MHLRYNCSANRTPLLRRTIWKGNHSRSILASQPLLQPLRSILLLTLTSWNSELFKTYLLNTPYYNVSIQTQIIVLKTPSPCNQIEKNIYFEVKSNHALPFSPCASCCKNRFTNHPTKQTRYTQQAKQKQLAHLASTCHTDASSTGWSRAGDQLPAGSGTNELKARPR